MTVKGNVGGQYVSIVRVKKKSLDLENAQI